MPQSNIAGQLMETLLAGSFIGITAVLVGAVMMLIV
jgi:hypothetical protein